MSGAGTALRINNSDGDDLTQINASALEGAGEALVIEPNSLTWVSVAGTVLTAQGQAVDHRGGGAFAMTDGTITSIDADGIDTGFLSLSGESDVSINGTHFGVLSGSARAAIQTTSGYAGTLQVSGTAGLSGGQFLLHQGSIESTVTLVGNAYPLARAISVDSPYPLCGPGQDVEVAETSSLVAVDDEGEVRCPYVAPVPAPYFMIDDGAGSTRPAGHPLDWAEDQGNVLERTDLSACGANGPSRCFMAGLVRAVRTAQPSCDGLYADDTVRALQWRCVERLDPGLNENVATLVSTTFQPGRGLTDLLDPNAPDWGNVGVEVRVNGHLFIVTGEQRWWQDDAPITPLVTVPSALSPTSPTIFLIRPRSMGLVRWR